MIKLTVSALVASLAIGLVTSAVPQAANAQGVLHRHPVASGIAAGLVAHHYAKKGARRRAASGRRGNFAERHPIMSGVAAGMAAHHLEKRH